MQAPAYCARIIANELKMVPAPARNLDPSQRRLFRSPSRAPRVPGTAAQ